MNILNIFRKNNLNRRKIEKFKTSFNLNVFIEYSTDSTKGFHNFLFGLDYFFFEHFSVFKFKI